MTIIIIITTQQIVLYFISFEILFWRVRKNEDFLRGALICGRRRVWSIKASLRQHLAIVRADAVRASIARIDNYDAIFANCKNELRT